MKNAELKDAAKYFYNSFLGLIPDKNDKYLTKKFFDESKKFINSLSIPSEEKVEKITDLYSYMRSNQTLLAPQDFADNYLTREQADQYIEQLISRDVPARGITKDLTYIDRSIRQRRIKFNSNVYIVAPSADFDKLVKVKENESNSQETIVTIQGSITFKDE